MKDSSKHDSLGLYIHWPFCQSKCPYCDFNSHTNGKIDHDKWRCAYQKALHLQSAEMHTRDVGSIYFGGGTPSLMKAKTVATILDIAADIFHFTPNIEITIEANPTSVEIQKLRDFRVAGINRLSLGIQALNDKDLRRLGRTHTAKEGVYALECAQSIFSRVSFDLIYARQYQTLTAWEDELNKALGLASDHFSLYQLTIEPNTSFFKRYKMGRLSGLPNEELGADMYEMTLEICAKHHLEAYEISNFARSGQECRHNMLYWRAGDFLGIGPGAQGRFFRNEKRIETYSQPEPALWLQAVLTGSNFIVEENVTDSDYLSEIFLMGLRLKKGIARERLDRLDAFPSKKDIIHNLVRQGFLEFDEKYLRTSPRGRLVLDSILRELL